MPVHNRQRFDPSLGAQTPRASVSGWHDAHTTYGEVLTFLGELGAVQLPRRLRTVASQLQAKLESMRCDLRSAAQPGVPEEITDDG